MSAPEAEFDGENAPAQDDYVSRTGQKDVVPVESDNAGVEDPIDEETADSDAQLGMSSDNSPCRSRMKQG